jgi:PAS domain S-box-containing protein
MDVLQPLPQHLLRLMHHNLDFVEILGANGVLQSVTAAIKPLGGYDARDLIGGQYQDIVHPEDRARAAAALAHALHGTRAETVKLRYLAKGGSWRTILVSTQCFLGDPAFHAVVVPTRDVTEQCDAESSLVLANARVAELTEQLTRAEEKQRRFFAAELHDDVQQILFGLRMSMAPSRRTPADHLPNDLVEGWMQLVQTAIDHLHELTVVLRKPVIDNPGLPNAMRSYVDHLPLAPNQKVMFETDANVGALAPNVALACFRIVQEGLGNAVRHSGAKNLQVCLKNVADRLTVSIRDDGVGFDVIDARAHATDAGSVGLSSMRERAALAGGRFEIESSIGHGTRICASFPVDPLIRQP